MEIKLLPAPDYSRYRFFEQKVGIIDLEQAQKDLEDVTKMIDAWNREMLNRFFRENML